MVETPDAGEGKQSQEKGTPDIIASTGNAPAPQTQGKETDTSNARKHSRYVTWPFVKMYQVLRRVFLLADEHSGGITAIATVLIACLTFLYVESSREQERFQKVQARVAYGAPFLSVRPNWTGLYNLGENRRPRVHLHLRNQGLRDAQDIYAVMKIGFRENAPTPERKPKFVRTDTYTLPPVIKDKTGEIGPFASVFEEFGTPISTTEFAKYKAGITNFFIWGQFTYLDFTGHKTRDGFCFYVRYVDAPSAGEGPEGYSTPYNDCNNAKVFPQ